MDIKLKHAIKSRPNGLSVTWQLVGRLKEHILDNPDCEGRPFLTIKQIMHTYDVSIKTAEKAIHIMGDFLTREKGYGYTVAIGARDSVIDERYFEMQRQFWAIIDFLRMVGDDLPDDIMKQWTKEYYNTPGWTERANPFNPLPLV